MKQEHWTLLRGHSIDACVELLETYGVASAPGEDAEALVIPGDAVAAFIGFSGGHLMGSLVLLCSLALVKRAYPLRGGVGAEDLEDWLGELANQLLGRIKNRLARYGACIEMSTPMVVAGMNLGGIDERHAGPRGALPWLRLHCDGLELGVRLRVQVLDEHIFTAEPIRDSQAIPEGALILF